MGKKEKKEKKENFIIILIIIIFSIIIIYKLFKNIFKLHINTNILKKLIKFLKKYNIISALLLFIIGNEAQKLGSSLINDIIMPILDPIIGKGRWETSTKIGPFNFHFGKFISSLFKFILTILMIFVIYLNFKKYI